MIRSLKIAASLFAVTMLSACAHDEMKGIVGALEARVSALEAKSNSVAQNASTAKIDAATALHIAVPMQADVNALKADVKQLVDSHSKNKKMKK
jgi:outer membrane murein-binding lipoprotein Lpp